MLQAAQARSRTGTFILPLPGEVQRVQAPRLLPVFLHISMCFSSCARMGWDLRVTAMDGPESAEPEGHFEGQNGARRGWFGLAYASASQRIAWSGCLPGLRESFSGTW